MEWLLDVDTESSDSDCNAGLVECSDSDCNVGLVEWLLDVDTEAVTVIVISDSDCNEGHVEWLLDVNTEAVTVIVMKDAWNGLVEWLDVDTESSDSDCNVGLVEWLLDVNTEAVTVIGDEIKEKEEELKRNLKSCIEMSVSKEELAECLACDRDQIESTMDGILLDADKQLLYPKDAAANIDIDTWTLPLLCFVIPAFLRVKLKSCIYIDLVNDIDMSKQNNIRLHRKFRGKLENLINELDQNEDELKSKLKEGIGMRLSEGELAERLVQDISYIKQKIDMLLLGEDKQILYPEGRSVNTDMDTWTVPLLCFVMAGIFGRNVKSCINMDLVKEIDNSIKSPIGLQRRFDGKLNNLINELDCNHAPKSLDMMTMGTDEEGAETRQKNLFQNVCDEETTADKEEISVSLNEKGGEINEHSNLEKSVSKDEEGPETSPKYLFQNVSDEETTEVKEEKSDSLNEKEDDKEETVNDAEETYKHVLDRSISTIKECMNPEPILDSLLEDNVFQYIDIRDIMELANTTKKNETIIEKVRQSGTDVYKLFKKYLEKSHQYLLLKFIEKTEKGEETTDIQNELKEQTRQRLKDLRNKNSIEETSVNLLEEQLVISIQKGKEFEGTEDIEEKLDIFTSSNPISRKCCNVVKGIFEGTLEKYPDQLIKAVKDVASIMNVEIKSASVDKDNTVVMTMACASCEEIRMLLKILKGNEFKSKIENLQTVLSNVYEAVCVIYAKVSHEKIQEVQKHLMDQGVINEGHADDLFCDTHHKQQVELFCPAHDNFFCHKCEGKHRKCQGVRQITEDVSTKLYRIRSDEPARKVCSTIKLCTLPSGEILLIDNVNKKLKKLDLTYRVVGQYTFNESETPFDICAIHASKAFVTFGHHVCVVNVGDIHIQVDKVFKTKAPCLRLYSKDSAIYYTDNLSIYTCDENGENHKKLHQFGKETFCHSLVVSDDRSKIVVAAGGDGLIIIDANSQNPSTVALKELQGCTDLCIVKNDMLLVCASNTLFLVNIKLGKVLKQAAIGLRCPRSFAFDVIDNSVIGGNLGNDFISVFNVNIEYDST
ncbi:uncharacterized protein LOC132757095 [Ruditapes philippinarum]|uniref:uncharacterized protein LOC132757095 n=1 Tax=Ruditapes philippinarum TaxID=129788 RepID=UPI00295A594E|nr:uncharacterized protein LOC132757095 [Ruditapes philippinarum]